MRQLNIGEQLRKWRRYAGLTQIQLEGKAGLGHNTVSRIERGQQHPQLTTVDNLARALGISPNQLQFGSPPEEAPPAIGEMYKMRLMADIQKLDEETCEMLYPVWKNLLDLLEKKEQK